jgi:predicted AAA+ superfamily ATPase
MIKRKIEKILRELAKQYPVVTITGPRQSGKTTLCRYVFKNAHYVNLEAPDARKFAVEDPRGFLKQYGKNVVLDEIQRVPQLLSYIQTIVDENNKPGQFILTGSNHFGLMNWVSQSLAGRTAIITLLPFGYEEIQHIVPHDIDTLLYTGFYPRIYDKGLHPTQALADYVATYVERDVRQLAAIKDPYIFEKFLRLCAGRVGQLLNMQSLASDVGVSHTTIRAWISILEASYIIFLLQPWYGNVSKRLVKSPKLYFYDVGLATYLLGIENEKQMQRDPLRGNLFENMVIAEIIKYRFNRGKRSNIYFYRDSKGTEIDVLYEYGREVFPIEIKAGATVVDEFFKNIKAFNLLIHSDGGAIIYGGTEVQNRTTVRVVPFAHLLSMLDSIESK